jgi:hypothetical protein
MLPQIILVVQPQFFQTPVSLSSVFFDVPEAWLPSVIFCPPLRAACTI